MDETLIELMILLQLRLKTYNITHFLMYIHPQHILKTQSYLRKVSHWLVFLKVVIICIPLHLTLWLHQELREPYQCRLKWLREVIKILLAHTIVVQVLILGATIYHGMLIFPEEIMHPGTQMPIGIILHRWQEIPHRVIL